MIDNNLLLHRVKDVVQDIGVARVTAANIVSKLQADKSSLVHVPSISSVRKILKEKFGMSFRCANAANIKYNDTSYDEKRVWVSRLLAQFLMADVVIISIDESSFK